MTARLVFSAALVTAGLSIGQEPAQPGGAAPQAEAAQPVSYTVETGSKVPLSVINSVSTKHSAVGDRVYLETVFPVLAGGRIVIPVGSSVAGTVTQIKKPGRIKGRGELYVRFDSLILPNGVTRDFHARIGGMDGTAPGTVDRTEGKIESEGNKGGDMQTIGETTAAGATLGAIAGNAAGRSGLGIGVGAGAGLTAGLIGVLATRGPDAVLEKGSTVEMVLDRNLTFSAGELDFGNYQPPRMPSGQASQNNGKSGPTVPFPRRIPLL
jgi:type IV secretion system protein VirB10